MIERQFVNQKMKEHQVQEFLAKELAKTGYSHTEIQRTPLGEKVIVYTTRPGLVVGKKGENIKRLTNTLKRTFKMENPQIEIGEIANPALDARFIADRIVSGLERFGSKRFKSIGYNVLQEIIDAGALGAEIVLSGKLPSARAKTWRFTAGYLKKSGDVSESKVKKLNTSAKLKSGIIGVKVRIMTPDIILPDKMELRKKEIEVEEVKKPEEKKEAPENNEVERVEVKKQKKKKEEKPKEVKKVEKKTKKKETKKKVKKENGDNKKE